LKQQPYICWSDLYILTYCLQFCYGSKYFQAPLKYLGALEGRFQLSKAFMDAGRGLCKAKVGFTVSGVSLPLFLAPPFVEIPQGTFIAMLPKLELARVQASLAGWVVSKPAQCPSAAYTTKEVAAQQEQHKQLRRCKKTQCQQNQRDKALSQVQVKPDVEVHKGVVALFLRLQSSSSGSQPPSPC
jgi:hypothetical protein